MEFKDDVSFSFEDLGWGSSYFANIHRDAIDNTDREEPKITSYTLDGEQCTVETVGEGLVFVSNIFSLLVALSIIIL